MTGHLAVAMVTSTLRRIIGDALTAASSGGVGSAQVTTMRPSSLATVDAQASGVNVFLYRVSPKAGPGTGVTTQCLELDYLLTFYGDESTLEPQRLLGISVAALADHPVLDRALVADVRNRAVLMNPDAWEQFSDLATAPDVVRLSMIPLDQESATKLWSALFHSAYRLSVAYQATTVFISGDTAPEAKKPEHVNVRVTPSARTPQ
jgi:Pvc16 N-terminal domain